MPRFKSFMYDPQVLEYNTSKWFKTLSGSPSYGTSVITVNNAEASMIPNANRGIFELEVNIPTSPAAGDDKKWGVKSVGGGAAAYFRILENVFTANVIDNAAAFTATVTLTWSTAWANAAVVYAIQIEAGLVKFMIDGVTVATVSTGTGAFSEARVSPWIDNNDADNVKISWIAGHALQGYQEPIV